MVIPNAVVRCLVSTPAGCTTAMTWTGVGPLGPQKVYRIVEIPFAIKRWFDFQRYQYFSMLFTILMSLDVFSISLSMLQHVGGRSRAANHEQT